MFYKDGIAKTEILWSPPTENTDGSPYGETQHGGYELGVVRDGSPDPVPHISVPAAYSVTSWPMSELGLDYGVHQIALRTVNARGVVSAWSGQIEIEKRDERIPAAPTNFSCA